MNKVIFENGIEHEFSDDELRLLRLMIVGKPNLKDFLPLDKFSYEEASRRFDLAFDKLYSLFIYHLD